MEQEFMLYFGAMALGALHAFEPGHGKTLIAAYMIGTRGRALDGILLGLIVTFTHTFSVIILGIVAKILSRHYSETELHGWLGLVSAVIILAVGLWMLKQRISGKTGHGHLHLFGKRHDHHEHPHGQHEHSHGQHDHDHAHDDDHSHDHSHEPQCQHTHGHVHPERQQQARFTKWNLLFLGVSGGLIPCPAAIATLLAAIAAGRIAQGLTMAIFFSLGLGLVMMTIGVVLSQAGRFIENLGSNQEFSRRMGILSALVITVLGFVTLYHSVVSLLAA